MWGKGKRSEKGSSKLVGDGIIGFGKIGKEKQPSFRSFQPPKASYKWSNMCLPLNRFCCGGVIWATMSASWREMIAVIHFRHVFCRARGRRSLGCGTPATFGIGLSRVRDHCWGISPLERNWLITSTILGEKNSLKDL